MINKIIIDDSNVTLNESTAFPFTYTFSKSGVHKVKIGLEDTDEICAYAFKDCHDLTKIVFPNIITKIKRNAFENCSSLRKLDIPATIEYVGPNVFDGCDSLTEITFEAATPPTFHATLSEFTNCYIPTDSKFIKVEDNSTLVKDGSVQYYVKNFLGGYDAVDFESLEDDEEYYYDGWTSVHDHLNTIEEKNRIMPTNIGFYDEFGDVFEYPEVGSASTYNLFDICNIRLTPENCTNKHYTLFSNNPGLVDIDNEGNITTTYNMGGRAILYAYTEPDYNGDYASASIFIRVINNQNIQKDTVEMAFVDEDGDPITMFELTPENKHIVKLPTFSINNTNVPVTFTSSAPSVAIINENREIVIKGKGQTIITVSAAETSTTKPASFEFIISVSATYEEDDDTSGDSTSDSTNDSTGDSTDDSLT